MQHCDQCQKTKRKLDDEAAPCTSSWKQIEIDLIRPLPTTTNGNKHVIVVTDYFSKWCLHQKKPLMLRSGACASRYEAKEDDEAFKVSSS